MNRPRHSPPEIGGVDATSRRSREASFKGADGVVKYGTLLREPSPKHFGNPDHPVCAAAVASHLLIDGAATPPISGFAVQIGQIRSREGVVSLGKTSCFSVSPNDTSKVCPN